jgi:hypothetical protein
LNWESGKKLFSVIISVFLLILLYDFNIASAEKSCASRSKYLALPETFHLTASGRDICSCAVVA